MGMVEGADGVDIDVQCHKYPKLTRVTCTLLRAYPSFFAISILENPSIEHILLIARAAQIATAPVKYVDL